MALLTVTEAARLARRSRASIYRDLEKGRLDKVFTADGTLKIDSAALARAYGEIGRREEPGAPGASPAATDKAIQAVLRQVDGAAEDKDREAAQEEARAAAMEVAMLRERLAACEQRMALLERIAQLEKATRQAADVTWRERLQAKDEVIAAMTLALARPQQQPARDDGWPKWRHSGSHSGGHGVGHAAGTVKRAIN